MCKIAKKNKNGGKDIKMGKNWDKVYPNSSKLAKISKNINPVY